MNTENLLKIANTCRCTMKDASFDTANKEYMTECEFNVYSLDSYKDLYAKTICPISAISMKSCDALFVNDEDIYLLEFKNGKISTSERHAIKQKIYDTLLMLLDELEEHVSFSREKMTFVLIYNAQNNSRQNTVAHNAASIGRDELLPHLNKLSGKPIVRFGLANMKLFFKDIFTYSREEFHSLFLSSHCSTY